MFESKILIEGLEYNDINKVCMNHGLYDSLEEIFDDTYIEDVQEIKKLNKGVKEYVKNQCNIHNINYNKIINKIKDGYSIDSAIEDELKQMKLIEEYLQSEIIINGETYTINDACEKYDKNYIQIQKRLDNGWTPEEAFIVDSNVSIKAKLIYLEENIYSFEDACKKYKVPRGIVERRFLWQPEEAFEIIPKEFPNLKTNNVIYHRPLKDLKRDWTKYGYKKYYDELERLVNLQKLAVNKNNHKHYYCNFGYETSDISYYNNKYRCEKFVDLNNNSDRYYKGCYYCKNCKIDASISDLLSIDNSKILHTSVSSEHYIHIDTYYLDRILEMIKDRKYILVEGKFFNSVSEACRYYNVDMRTIYGRLNRGWGIDVAFKSPSIR